MNAYSSLADFCISWVSNGLKSILKLYLNNIIVITVQAT